MKFFKSLSLMVAAMAISVASFAQSLEVDNQTTLSLGNVDVNYTNSNTDQFSVTTTGIHSFSTQGTIDDVHLCGITLSPGETGTGTVSGQDVEIHFEPGGDKIIIWDEVL